MNLRALLFTLALVLSGIAANAQSPIGTWKTIDDETGEEKSYVQIYEQNGKLYGKIVRLLQLAPDATCDACPDEKKDKPLVGMQIMWDLEAYRDYWSYGHILDPKKGKTYKCSIWMESADQLQVRGYLGVSALGRTQTWYRVK